MSTERPYLPIAIGFYLLGLPLWGLAAFTKSRAESWTYLIVGAALVAIGLALHRRSK